MRQRILDASIRVLERDGALGFTTTRVADEAGISVGSLYQYFPNKHALVFALHDDDVEEGAATIRSILQRDDRSPSERIVELFIWFFESEATEVAEMGAVMDDIEVFLRGGPPRDDLRQGLVEDFAAFVAESSSTDRAPSEATFAAQLALTTMESVGKSVAARQASARTTRRWATAMAEMVSTHLSLP